MGIIWRIVAIQVEVDHDLKVVAVLIVVTRVVRVVRNRLAMNQINIQEEIEQEAQVREIIVIIVKIAITTVLFIITATTIYSDQSRLHFLMNILHVITVIIISIRIYVIVIINFQMKFQQIRMLVLMAKATTNIKINRLSTKKIHQIQVISSFISKILN